MTTPPFPIVYKFDINHRVYKRDASGRALGGPIYREHFLALHVMGETKKSWIVSNFVDGRHQYKIGKDNVYTAEQVDDKCWMDAHHYQVSQAVYRCKDIDTLKAITALVGYVRDDAL